ncbi:MAG: Unknown protein [uncultured Sulfurovum sp.]|uniref:Uncharacterized protein n=1 Tax=uncultured Sulfurovum sp. TaxID=269237 RepID=A0A6S6T189_9BACT|nr:MAG: Unknown protein [uncultured Sulfurovum sp.]
MLHYDFLDKMYLRGCDRNASFFAFSLNIIVYPIYSMMNCIIQGK